MFADSEPDQSTGTRSFLEGDIIHEVYEGDQTRETVVALNTETDDLVAELQAQHKPILILSEFTDIGDHDEGALDETKKVLGTRYYDRVAAFGVPTRLEIVGRLLLAVTGQRGRVRIFDTQDEAETWLREFTPAP